MTIPARLRIAALVALPLCALAQYPGTAGGRVAQPRTATAVPANGLPEAIATVNGTFKSADKKFITVQVEDDQLMRMYITGSTKFIRDGKLAKASEFELGEPVIVDTTRDARMNLLAVRIELIKPATKAPATEAPATTAKPDPKPPADQ